MNTIHHIIRYKKRRREYIDLPKNHFVGGYDGKAYNHFPLIWSQLQADPSHNSTARIDYPAFFACLKALDPGTNCLKQTKFHLSVTTYTHEHHFYITLEK